MKTITLEEIAEHMAQFRIREAAPQLLEACIISEKLIYDLSSYFLNWNPENISNPQIYFEKTVESLEKIRDAINKAKGMT